MLLSCNQVPWNTWQNPLKYVTKPLRYITSSTVRYVTPPIHIDILICTGLGIGRQHIAQAIHAAATVLFALRVEPNKGDFLVTLCERSGGICVKMVKSLITPLIGILLMVFKWKQLVGRRRRRKRKGGGWGKRTVEQGHQQSISL